MQSKAALGGHPIHPMLVAFPIGLVVWTFLSDLIYLATDKNPMWYDIAFYSGLAAWISALVAALPGLLDYLTVVVKTDARELATAHMALNVTMVGLFAVASVFMWDHGALTGGDLTLVVVLHAIGVGILSVSGWLGGEIVYRRHMAMIQDDLDLERAERERPFEPATCVRSERRRVS
jgi:uncharacterized membrane protein